MHSRPLLQPTHMQDLWKNNTENTHMIDFVRIRQYHNDFTYRREHVHIRFTAMS